VVLYYLATGARPFGNPTSQRELRRRLYRDPVAPRARAPSVPPWLQEIILRCLEVDPAKRYETAAQLALDLSHPEQVRLTARAERLRRDSLATVWRRKWRSLGQEPAESKSAADRLARAPIVMVAVDVAADSAGLAEELRLAARRILQTESGARLACVTVLKTSRIAMDIQVDEEGRNLHVRRLIELKHWARPLNLPPAKISFHVLSAPDPGAAIIEFARSNHVDQIVIGSRGSSTLRRYLGSVSSQVVAQAECTVTVVKAGAAPLLAGIPAPGRETAGRPGSE
jgi:nucleotide-binding universal stress UspA family protein